MKIPALEKVAQEELLEVQDTILNSGITKDLTKGIKEINMGLCQMTKVIKEGKIVAFSMKDKETSNIYLVEKKVEHTLSTSF